MKRLAGALLVLYATGCGGENDTFGDYGPCGRGERVVGASDSPFGETPEHTWSQLGTFRATVHWDSPDNPAPTIYDHEALGDPILTVFQPSDCGLPPIRMHAGGTLIVPVEAEAASVVLWTSPASAPDRNTRFQIDDPATEEWALDLLGETGGLGVAVELFSSRAALRFAGSDESSPGFDLPAFEGTVTYSPLP